MDDDAGGGGAFTHRHLPSLGRSGDEHGARGGACLAQLVPATRNRRRAAGSLIAVDLGIDQRLIDPHRLPIGVELLGDDQAEGGLDALADLRTFGNDRDRIVRRHPHEGIERGGLVPSCVLGAGGAGVEMEGQHQPATGKARQLQKGSTSYGCNRRRDRLHLCDDCLNLGIVRCECLTHRHGLPPSSQLESRQPYESPP